MQCCLSNSYKRITDKIDFSNISKQFVAKSEDVFKNYKQKILVKLNLNVMRSIISLTQKALVPSYPSNINLW